MCVFVTVCTVLCICVITAPSYQYCPSCLLSSWCHWWSAGRNLWDYKVPGWSNAGIAHCSREWVDRQIFSFTQKTEVATMVHFRAIVTIETLCWKLNTLVTTGSGWNSNQAISGPASEVFARWMHNAPSILRLRTAISGAYCFIVWIMWYLVEQCFCISLYI